MTQRADIGQQLHRLWKARRYPSPLWIAQRLLHPLAFALALPFYDVKVGVAVITLLRTLGILPSVLDTNERHGQQPLGYRYPGVLARWAVRQLKQLNDRNNQRRMRAAVYTELFKSHQNVQLQQFHASTVPVFLRFAALVDNPVVMKQFFARHDIFLGDWYDTPIAPRTVDPAVVEYVPGSCPAAERSAVRVVNMPTHPVMTEREFARVKQILQEYLHTLYGNHAS